MMKPGTVYVVSCYSRDNARRHEFRSKQEAINKAADAALHRQSSQGGVKVFEVERTLLCTGADITWPERPQAFIKEEE